MAKNINLRMTYYGVSNIEELIKDTVEDMYAGAMNFKGTIIGENWQIQMPKTYSKGDVYAIQLDPNNEQQSFLIIANNSRNVESAYLEEEWQEVRSDKGISADSKIMASQVYLDNAITLSGGFDKVGNLDKNAADHTLEQDQTLQSVLEEMLAKDMRPTPVNPVCSLSFTNKVLSFEVGTKVEPEYNFVFASGYFKYEDGSIMDGEQDYKCFIGDTQVNNQGTLDAIQITETPYTISGKISYTESVEGLTKPKDEATGIKIPAGEANVTTTNSLTGFRNLFYYCGKTIGGDITSNIIRGWANQPSTNKTIKFKNATGYDNSTGAIYVAIPNKLTIKSASQNLVGESPLNITDQFIQIGDVDVNGANGYDAEQYILYRYNPAKLPGNYEFTINIS
jgi:hypothetical protein